jgi:hypothetical protein
VGELVERALRHEPAAADHHHLVDGLRHLGQHVARHEHRAPLARLAAQELAQPADALGIEAVGGLVEHERARVAEQRSREAQPLAHAERVALHAPPAGAVELDQPEHLVDPARREPGRGGQDAQVVASGPARVELRAFQHGADDLHRIVQLPVGAALDRGRPRGGQRQAEQRAQRSGLAGTIGSEEAEHAAGGGLEGEPVDRDVRPESLRQVADLEHRWHASAATGASRIARR